MVEKIVLSPERVRRINGSFAFIEHRFLRDGFFDALDHHELLLYLFLVLAADRNGVSFYCYDRLCAHLRISVDDYIEVRNALIRKDLLAFDGRLFQVLSLPKGPCLEAQANMQRGDPATIRRIIEQSLSGGSHD